MGIDTTTWTFHGETAWTGMRRGGVGGEDGELHWDNNIQYKVKTKIKQHFTFEAVAKYFDFTKLKSFRRFLHNSDVLAPHFTRAVDFLRLSSSEQTVEGSALVLVVHPGIASVDVLHMDHDCKVPQVLSCPQNKLGKWEIKINQWPTEPNRSN